MLQVDGLLLLATAGVLCFPHLVTSKNWVGVAPDEHVKPLQLFDIIKAPWNWIGLAQGIVGSTLVFSDNVLIATEPQGGKFVILSQLGLLVIGTVCQTLRHRGRLVILFPFFYFCGLLVPIQGPWIALFCWVVSLMLYQNFKSVDVLGVTFVCATGLAMYLVSGIHVNTIMVLCCIGLVLTIRFLTLAPLEMIARPE